MFYSIVKKRTKDHILVSVLKELITKSMNFPPFNEEVAVFVKYCDKTKEDTPTWEEIHSALNYIGNAFLNEQAKKA